MCVIRYENHSEGGFENRKKNAPVIILRRPMRPKLHRDDICTKVYHVKKICQEIFKLITKGAGEFGQSVIFY